MAATLSTFKPYLGRVAVFVALIALTIFTAPLDAAKNGRSGSTAPAPDRAGDVLRNDPRRTPSKRPRVVDRELFPDSLWNPSTPSKE